MSSCAPHTSSRPRRLHACDRKKYACDALLRHARARTRSVPAPPTVAGPRLSFLGSLSNLCAARPKLLPVVGCSHPKAKMHSDECGAVSGCLPDHLARLRGHQRRARLAGQLACVFAAWGPPPSSSPRISCSPLLLRAPFCVAQVRTCGCRKVCGAKRTSVSASSGWVKDA